MSFTSVEPLEQRQLFSSAAAGQVIVSSGPTWSAPTAYAAGTVTTKLFKLVKDPLHERVVVAHHHVQYPTMQTQRIRMAGGHPSYGVDDGGHITIDDGHLTIRGTAADDAVEVYATGTRVEVHLRSGTGKHAIDYLNNYPAALVGRVAVDGLGGHDVLRVNVGVQRVTSDAHVEARYTEEPDGTALPSSPSLPLPGVYDGSTHNWLATSKRQIESAHKANATVALVGDSLMDYFDEDGAATYASAFGHHPVDLGLAGDTTSQVLYRIQSQGLLDGMSPKVVVLEIGANNMVQSADPVAIARGIGTVVAAIRAKLPHAKVLINGTLPEYNEFATTIARVNARVAALDDGDAVRFLDPAPTFTAPNAADDDYRPDGIHLVAAGYVAWSKLMRPLLNEMLA